MSFLMFTVIYAGLAALNLFGMSAWDKRQLLRATTGKAREKVEEDPAIMVIISCFWPFAWLVWSCMLARRFAHTVGEGIHNIELERELKRTALKGSGTYRDPLRCGSCDAIFVDEDGASRR